MLYTVKQDLKLCEQFKLTPMQLFFLKTKVRNPSKTESDQARESKQLALKFQTVFKKQGIKLSELADLISRDIVVDNNEHGAVYFDLYELSGKWQNKLRLAVYPMPQELWDKYPVTITIDGKNYPARSASAEDLAQPYLKAIDNEGSEHQKVLDDVQWAIDNNELKIGLKKFVEQKYWLYIRAIRNSKADKGTFTHSNIL